MRSQQRRRSVYEEDGRYDLGNASVNEKNDGEWQDSFDTSIDSDDDQPSSTGSSRETHGSRQPMLSKPSRRAASYYRYRLPAKMIRYLCLALMSTILLFILSLVRMSWLSSRHIEMGDSHLSHSQPAQWESFEFLKRYYGGIRTLVPRDQNIPEYPRDHDTAQSTDTDTDTLQKRELPLSAPFHPYPNYTSTNYKFDYGPVRECYLNDEDKIKVPDIHSYYGIPQGLPDPVMGSDELLELQNTICFDRYGRLGAYGFGYSLRKGGTGAGLNGDRDGAEDIWSEMKEVDYRLIQWGDAQRRCAEKNNHRFELPSERVDDFSSSHIKRDKLHTAHNPKALKRREGPPADFLPLNHSDASTVNERRVLTRTAIILRTWWDFKYTQEDILYLRSLIAELSLLSGAEYTIHFLIHVKDDNMPIWADRDTYNRVLENALPEEFRGMGTLWSERQMGLIYGGLAESFYRDLPVHGVYRSSFMPLQYFAHQHPEYSHFWNWEMDIRYTGHWYHLFDKVRKWAKEQPRKGLWERNERFYIPSVHGTWAEFKQLVRFQSEMGTESSNNMWSGLKTAAGEGQGAKAQPKVDKPVWGPLPAVDALKFNDDPVPPTSFEKDKYSWGVGEEADLITFNPVFNPEGTTWILADDVTGYNTTDGPPPRRTAIVTASRLSRRLLDAMHQEVALQRHTMFSEMWPASCALHHGLKAVYVPHPVYIDRDWPTSYLASVMNGGRNGASGGARTSVFGDREHNFRGTTWYYNAGFSPNLWRRWLGYRVDNSGGEEEELAGEGRMCLPGMLLHPVKGVELVIEGLKEEDVVPDQAEGSVKVRKRIWRGFGV